MCCHADAVKCFSSKLVKDAKLKADFKTDPAGTLKANGVTVPAGARVVIREVQIGTPFLVIPTTREEWSSCANNADIGKVVDAAFADPAVMQQLCREPGATFAKVLGKPFAPAVKMQVYRNSATEFNVVIPTSDAPLSERDLEQVAGGGIITGTVESIVCNLSRHTGIGCNSLCCTVCELMHTCRSVVRGVL
ncbi:MAG TPA: hypothetical protein PKM88_15230 [bacterium]|nr:hypothetical protein [bacterium]